MENITPTHAETDLAAEAQAMVEQIIKRHQEPALVAPPDLPKGEYVQTGLESREEPRLWGPWQHSGVWVEPELQLRGLLCQAIARQEYKHKPVQTYCVALDYVVTHYIEVDARSEGEAIYLAAVAKQGQKVDEHAHGYFEWEETAQAHLKTEALPPKPA